jgi:hypothetical protein
MLETMMSVTIDGIDKFGHLGDAMSDDEVPMMGMLIGLVSVLLVFGTPIIIVLAGLRHRTARQKMINELVLRLAEKGQPIPPELFLEPVRPQTDLRRGIIWAMIGVGIVIFGLFQGSRDLMGIGFIPLMIGIGFFVAAKLELQQKKDQQK